MTPAARALALSLMTVVSGAAACEGGEDGKASGATAGAGGSVSSGRKAAGFPCTDPQPLLVDGEPSGMVACADGSFSRVAATRCRLVEPGPRPNCPVPAAGAGGGAGSGDTSGGRCTVACDAAPYGSPRGIQTASGSVYSESTCSYACATDADCPTGRSCACDGTGNGVCVKADCVEAAGCAAGDTCRLAQTGLDCSQSEPTLTCVGAADECLDVSDCGPNAQRCVAAGPQDATLRCLGGAGCGRPILVAEIALLAPLERSRDWSAALPS